MSKYLTTKRIVGAVLAVALVAAIVYGFLPQPHRVETAAVSRGHMEVVVEEEGQTRVVDRFVITAPVSGFARRLELDVGDSVDLNETVLAIEPMRVEALNPQRRAEAEARVAAARAALQSAEEAASAAKADATLADEELVRVRSLFDGNAATQREVDFAAAQARRAAAQASSADFSVEVAGHNLEAAQTALRFAGASGGGVPVSIRTPVAGRVLAIHHESEGVVAPGAPLLEVGDPQRLEVAIDVLSQDAVRIEPGTPVRFVRWSDDDVALDGVVRVVEPVGFTKISALGVEEQRVWIVADFTSGQDATSRLGHGYRIVAQFIVWQSDDAMRVPSSAVFRKGTGWATFVVDGNRAVERMIQIGERSGLTVQALSGVQEGDRVVVHPASELSDGDRVKLRGD